MKRWSHKNRVATIRWCTARERWQVRLVELHHDGKRRYSGCVFSSDRRTVVSKMARLWIGGEAL